jgi:hypothetical protein
MWSENARARVRGAGHNGKLQLLLASASERAVPHIFRRKRALPIISLTHRSGGPSGSANTAAHARTRPTLSGQPLSGVRSQHVTAAITGCSVSVRA